MYWEYLPVASGIFYTLWAQLEERARASSDGSVQKDAEANRVYGYHGWQIGTEKI